MIGCGKKVRFILAWQTYSVGDVIEPPAMQRDWLLANGYVADVVESEAEAGGGRPAKFARSAAKKIAEGAKNLFSR